jgi:hypothetical protein
MPEPGGLLQEALGFPFPDTSNHAANGQQFAHLDSIISFISGIILSMSTMSGQMIFYPP